MSSMYPVQVSTDERSIARLTDLYKTAYEQILSEVEGATSFGVANRKAILAQIEQILKDFGAEVNDVIDESISEQYKTGANQVIKQLEAQDAPLTNLTNFNQIHKEAVAALIDDTQRAFAESIQGVNRSAQQVISQAIRDQLTEKLAFGKISGETLVKIKRNVVGVFREQGLDAIVDKGGRGWSLDRYSEMLIRTKSVEARNRGLANRMVENDYDLVEVSSHGADDVCGEWEGKLLSVTGETPGYPTVADAEADGLFHPNCKHAINAVAPKLALLTNAYDSSEPTLDGEEYEKLLALQ